MCATLAAASDTRVVSPERDSSYNYYKPGGHIWKFGPNGNLVTTFNVADDSGGAGWLDLAADQRTMFYTPYGQAVKRFEIVTATQLADLTSSLPYYGADDLRVLPGGGVLWPILLPPRLDHRQSIANQSFNPSQARPVGWLRLG